MLLRTALRLPFVPVDAEGFKDGQVDAAVKLVFGKELRILYGLDASAAVGPAGALRALRIRSARDGAVRSFRRGRRSGANRSTFT